MSLKDIWNNIINFDLNKLAPNLSEVDLVFPVVLLSWMGFLFYMSRYIPESWEKTFISKTNEWYLRPLRWLSYILFYFLFMFILVLPLLFLDG